MITYDPALINIIFTELSFNKTKHKKNTCVFAEILEKYRICKVVGKTINIFFNFYLSKKIPVFLLTFLKNIGHVL